MKLTMHMYTMYKINWQLTYMTQSVWHIDKMPTPNKTPITTAAMIGDSEENDDTNIVAESHMHDIGH